MEVPTTIAAQWQVSTDPFHCGHSLNSNVQPNARVSAGGGNVSLVAEFGIRPFCHDESMTLVEWGPLASTTSSFLNQDVGEAFYSLPKESCFEPLDVYLRTGTAQTFYSGVPYKLGVDVTRRPPQKRDVGKPYIAVPRSLPCSDLSV